MWSTTLFELRLSDSGEVITRDCSVFCSHRQHRIDLNVLRISASLRE